MGASFRAELLVLGKWPAVWVIASLGPFLVLFFDYLLPYIFYLTAQSGTTIPEEPPGMMLPSLLPGQLVTVVVSSFSLYGTATAIVLGALVAGGDHGRGTLKTSLTQRPGRLATYAGQALALGTVLATTVLAAFAVGAICSLLITAIEGEVSPWPAASMSAGGIGVLLLVSATYGSFGLALGILFRGAGLAIGAGLVLALVVQGFLDTLALQIGGALEAVNKALPAANTLTLTGLFGAPGGGPDTDVLLRTSPYVAPWVLAAYAVAFLALAAILLLRRDVE